MDIATVDAKVPRAKAAFHTLIPGLAFVLGVWQLAAFVGIVMAISVVFGPAYSLFGRFYKGLIAPALKASEGSLEAAAPHRFAEAIGAIFLLAASAILASSTSGTAAVVGWSLTLIVVALAALNWLAGYCVGCKVYVFLARFRSPGSST
jgi:hypothetical protein